MTRAQIRRLAYQSLEHIDWLNKHVTARKGTSWRQLESVLRDLEKTMLKIIEAPIALKELKPGERDKPDRAELEGR